MKQLKLILLAAVLVGLSLLGAEPWQLDSDININLTQGAYSDNWTGTELSNITWAATSNTVAQKQMLGWLHNKTSFKLAFGQTHLQKENALGEKYWEMPVKSTDKIDLESLFKFTLQQWVDPYLAGRAESKFLDESDPALTRIVNPILFTESGGVMKTFLDSDTNKLSVRLGGAVRENLNREEMNLVTLQREMVTTIDGGLEGIAEYNHVFSAFNASYTSKLKAYQALFNSKSEDVGYGDNWKALDYSWENSLSAKLWGLLSANLTFNLLYDKELVDELQWKQILGLGFSYTLF